MSRVRPPPRRGGAALQMDVLELSSALDAVGFEPGRLRAAVEDCSNRAVRPDLEAAGARPPPAAAGRAGADYAAFRRALIAGALALGDGAAAPGAAPALSTLAGPAALADAPAPADEGAADAAAAAAAAAATAAWYGRTPPFASSPPPAAPDVEIPLLLDAARANGGAAGCAALSALLARAPKPLRRLAFLDLSHNAATDTGMAFSPLAELLARLAELPALRVLSLAGNALGGPGGAALARALRGGPGGARALTHLDVSDCALGAAGADELCAAFGRPLPAGEGEGDDRPPPGSAASADAALLAELEDPEIAAIIAAANAAREAERGGRKRGGGKAGPVAAGGAAGAPAPAPAPAPSPSTATYSGAAANTTLQWLDLSGNNLCAYGLDAAPAAALVRFLLAHPALRHLSLARNRLGDAKEPPRALVRGVRAAAAEGGGALVSLALDNNSLDAAPAAAVAQALEGNATLTHLSLRGNRVRSDGASAFAALLRRVTMAPEALDAGVGAGAGAGADAGGAGASGAGASGAGASGAAAGGTLAGGAAAPPPPREPARPPAPALLCLDLRDNYIGPIGRADVRLALAGEPPPPEVTRARADGGSGLDDDDGADAGGAHVLGGGAPPRDDAPSSVDGTPFSSRPASAAAASSLAGGAGDAELDAPRSLASSEADAPAAGAGEGDPRGVAPGGGAAAARAETPASEPLGDGGGGGGDGAGDGAGAGGAAGAGAPPPPSPGRQGAFTGVRAVMALRAPPGESGGEGRGGGADGGAGEGGATAADTAGDAPAAPPPPPSPPAVVTLADGALANAFGHRVYLTLA